MSSGSGQSNHNSYVSARKCDNFKTFECHTTPLTSHSILHVCIQYMDSDVEITFLNKLEVFQSNTLGIEIIIVVDGMTTQNNGFSSITNKNSTSWAAWRGRCSSWIQW